MCVGCLQDTGHAGEEGVVQEGGTGKGGRMTHSLIGGGGGVRGGVQT